MIPTLASIVDRPDNDAMARVSASPTFDYDSPRVAPATTMAVLWALSASHGINDTIQSLLPAIYPLLKQSYGLTYGQIGWLTFTTQLTASLLQPVIGTYADRRPLPFSLAAGMVSTLVGLLILSHASTMPTLLLAAAVVGLGSAVFHPEASRVAHMAAGGKHGFAQSLFQVGGNAGSSLGPLLAAGIIMRRGQASIAWFSLLAVAGMVVLTRVGFWYRANLGRARPKSTSARADVSPLSPERVRLSLAILVALVFSKYIYLVSLTNYYTFYLIHKFNVSTQASPIYLFVFLFAVAAGTFAGGPLGDRFGRKIVIWISILGVAPFSLALPHLNLPLTVVFSIFTGFILASAFSAILVFAQELVPGKVGMIAGLFFGFAFGISGVASAALGKLADARGIDAVFTLCSFLPLLGVLTMFLPDLRRRAETPIADVLSPAE